MERVRWPVLMRLQTAADYTERTRAQFRALVRAGLMPPGRDVEGVEQWSRRELDRAVERLFGMEGERAEDEGRQKAAEALERRRAKISGAHAQQGG